MKWLLLALALHISDQTCDKRERRCIEACNTQHVIGSMEHLDCKYQCWEDQRLCKEER